MIEEMLERFAKQTPIATMLRMTLVNVLSDEQLDRIFQENATAQRNGVLLFSTVANLLHLAVLKTSPSMHAAYQSKADEIHVSVKSVYDKLAGVELEVSRALVRCTGEKLAEIHQAMQPPQRQILPGYEVRVIDGSHFAATERRLGVHRGKNAAPLPGQALVVLDPQRMLIEDMIACECGHAQERKILHQLIDEPRQAIVWIADRNFCTSLWLQEIQNDQSWFIIRRHASFPIEESTPLKFVKRTGEGKIYEQEVVHRDSFGTELKLRRILLVLNQPTADGETQIELLTNLPSKVSAQAITSAYKHRWTIEAVFGELTLSLNGEINTLAYPPAAILAYALALLSYNVLSLVKSAVAAKQGEEVAAEMSMYYLAVEVAATTQGMMIAIEPEHWIERFAHLSPRKLATELKRVAGNVDLRRYRKHRRGPKKPKPKRIGTYQHQSTYKLLNARK